MRLQAPTHIVKSHFSEHQEVEGYKQTQHENSFLGCDRLMKYDNMFGTIQFGYDSRRDRTFIFANIKTSILDTAASKYQKELSEDSMKNQLKNQDENVAFSSKRLQDAASIFYKKDAKPWTEKTVAPYAHRRHLESLGKNMPFLQRQHEQKERLEKVAHDLELKAKVAEVMRSEDRSEINELRREQYTNLKDMEVLNSIIYRKASMSNMFFDRINMVFDTQKIDIFAYYKKVKGKADTVESDNEEAPPEEES